MPSHRDKRRDKLVAQAQPALTPGEEVLDATTGMVRVRRMGADSARNGVVLVTDRRVVLFTKKMGGYDMQDFAYGLLSSVDHKRGMMYGELDLAAAGDRSHVKQAEGRRRAHRSAHPGQDGRRSPARPGRRSRR